MMGALFQTWWPLFVIVGLVLATGWALWVSWKNEAREITIESKAEEYVNDAMQAEKARAETKLEEQSDRDALREFEKNFGGPK